VAHYCTGPSTVRSSPTNTCTDNLPIKSIQPQSIRTIRLRRPSHYNHHALPNSQHPLAHHPVPLTSHHARAHATMNAPTAPSKPFTPKRGIKTPLPPTLSTHYAPLEYSMHETPASLQHEIAPVFPDISLPRTKTLYLVPTIQRAEMDLLTFGDPQAAEKDRLLERFLAWGAAVRDAVTARQPDAWTDVTDPASGLAYFGRGAVVYGDVGGISRTLGYPTFDVGGCRVLKHPIWGFKAYPGTSPLHTIPSHAHPRQRRSRLTPRSPIAS